MMAVLLMAGISSPLFGLKILPVDLKAVEVAGDALVAVDANGNFLRSGDGDTFQLIQETPTTDRIYGMAATGSLLLAVGTDGIIYRSTNSGTGWNQINTESTSIMGDLKSVAGDGSGHWIAVGESGLARGAVVRSTDDGQTWSLVEDASTVPLNDVLYDPSRNKWYAVGQDDFTFSGKVIASSDGISWSEVADASSGLQAIARAGNGQLLAVGQNGIIMRAEAGSENFSVLEENFISGAFKAVISQGNGEWILAGTQKVFATIKNSTVKLLYAPSPGAEDVEDMGIFAGEVVAAGLFSGDTRLGESLDFRIESTDKANGTVDLVLLGATPGQEYEIQQSSDFNNWSPVQDTRKTASSSPLTWTIEFSFAGSSQSFFRAVRVELGN